MALLPSCEGHVASEPPVNVGPGPVWTPQYTGFDLNSGGGLSNPPAGVAATCNGASETWHYDVASASVTRTGCLQGQPLDGSIALPPAAMGQLTSQLSNIIPVSETQVSTCGGDAGSYTLTLLAPAASRTYQTCTNTADRSSFVAETDMFALAQQLDAFFTTYAPDGGVGSGLPSGEATDASATAQSEASPTQVTPTNVTPTNAAGESVVTLATGLISPYVLAVDASSVYWAEWGDGSLRGNGAVAKVPIGGGASTTLVSGLRMPGGIGVDANGVYYTASGGLFAVGLSGGTPRSLSSTFTNDNIVMGPGMVYGTGGADALYGVSVLGGSTQMLAGPIGIGGQNTYGLAVDSTSVYWSCFAGSCPVEKTPLDGGASTTLAMGSVVFGVAVDATNVYWAEASNGTIMKVPVGGGAATTVASGLSGPNQIAIDDKNLYVTTGTQGSAATGTIVRIAKDGSAVTFLATGLSSPSGIAVDATSVYWTTLSDGHTGDASASNGGAVMKASPK